VGYQGTDHDPHEERQTDRPGRALFDHFFDIFQQLFAFIAGIIQNV